MEQFSLLLAFSLLLHTHRSFVHRGQCFFNVRKRYGFSSQTQTENLVQDLMGDRCPIPLECSVT